MKVWPLPLHRSLVFWLGLFVLCFLIWAWVDSLFYATGWNRREHNKSVHSIRSSMSLLVFSHTTVADDRVVFGITGDYGTFYHVPAGAPIGKWNRLPGIESLSHPYVASAGYSYTHEVRRIVIPWWFIITCYLPPWLALAFWRAGRIARTRSLLPLPDTDATLRP